MERINTLDLTGKIKIIQDTEKGSYTFDSVLLAYFTEFKKKDIQVVDLCTGNAPIALLLTLKKADLQIKAIEIQKEISLLGAKSIKLNNLEDKVQMINADLIKISDKIGKNCYDVITCNPPYFRVSESSKININDAVSIARHELSVTLEDIIIEAKKLLSNVGTLNLVHRPDRLDEIIILLNNYGFTITKLQLVYPKIGRPANTVLIEAKKSIIKNNKLRILEPVFVFTEQNEYTAQAQEIMKVTKS
ncbi:MAG: tRNA1(Val) (adenine(37)-N6)-methyltransferase [Mycoplasmatales bacterium]